MTLILGSGHGLSSLYLWLRGSDLLPELLLLDVRYVSRHNSSNGGQECFAVSFLLPRSVSLLPVRVLQPMASDWRLTSWYVKAADSASWRMYGTDGEEYGEATPTPSTTRPDLKCS